MGCCQAKPGGLDKAEKATRWRSTGIVALRDSNLKTLPVDVVNIGASVRTLDATHNKLGTLPEQIGNFVILQRLILAENLLERLPSTIGKLRSLKILTLDSNRLSLLPEEVGLLHRLERLSVSRNNLKSLPSTLGNLPNLIQVDVSENRLETLPESIGNCKSLEELVANDNLIQELPESVSSLSHLKSLILSNQKLKQLPSRLLRDCTVLQTLMLHGTLIAAEQLHQMEGFEEYESRRKRKHDKQLDANVILDSRGFDEGVDTHLSNNTIPKLPVSEPELHRSLRSPATATATAMAMAARARTWSRLALQSGVLESRNAAFPWPGTMAPRTTTTPGGVGVPFMARSVSNQIVRARMKSVNNIKKITMAMKMVAASKLRTMQVKAENSRGMWQPFTALLGDAPAINADKKLIVVLATDKGLCGGINSTSVKYSRTLFRMHKAAGEGKEAKLTLIGDKGKAQLQREFSKSFTAFFTETQKVAITFTQCAMISDEIISNNKYDVLHMVFNKFESAVSFVPTVATILAPAMFETEEGQKVCKTVDYEIEDDENMSDVLMNLAEFQMAAVLYNGMLENATSEMGARMSAMDNSTRNAGDVLARLTLSYNRSRQSRITTELIEIISGAAALEG